MNNVKILLLTNNEYIISKVIDDKTAYIIEYPMSFSFDLDQEENEILNMTHWLPISVIKINKTRISKDKVITKLEPDESFIEFYLNRIFDSFSETDFMEEEESKELELLLEFTDAKHSNKIH